MENRDFAIILGGIALMLFILFIIIVHFIRRSKLPDKFIPRMDYGDIDVIDTLRYFFEELKRKKKSKKENDK